MSCKTSVAAVLVHALVFAVLLANLRKIPFLNRIEGFQFTRDGLANATPAQLEQYAATIKKLMQDDNTKLSATVKDLQGQIQKAQIYTRSEAAKYNQSLAVINQLLAEKRAKPAPAPTGTSTNRPAGLAPLPSTVPAIMQPAPLPSTVPAMTQPPPLPNQMPATSPAVPPGA